ncbi:MAG: phosphoribosyl-AMP cyclohydrolase, partial [Pseudomonadota bacterium]
MFKPPLAAVGQFRKTFPEALSDFVDILCAEDGGFAIKVFTNVSWESDGIFTTEHSAIAMANCFFTGPGAKETKVKKTFGY